MSPITHGANALKLENEIVQEQNSESLQTNENILQRDKIETERVVENKTVNEMEKYFTQEATEITNDTYKTDGVEEEDTNDKEELDGDSDSADLFRSE